MVSAQFKTGALVHLRGRDWVVLPSEDVRLLRIKPLGGRDDEAAGVWLPLMPPGSVRVTHFVKPVAADLGSIRAGRLLFDAARLSLRSAAGPFRCAAKLGFRPRSYQMVPLIMALKQAGPLRLLIADDVGVGKTIEALLIVKELLERREIQSFAVLCPPHLCDQWQGELKDKFQVEAVVIRTNTQAGLDRNISGDTSVFQYYPYQVVSIDFIKSDQRYLVYAEQAPELVIVDEAHTCAQPLGQNGSTGQQLRHRMIQALGSRKNRHLLLLTATPHSGKEAEFQSLLGLLKPELAQGSWDDGQNQEFREELARHFIQRRRGDIVQWLDEHTPFPARVVVDHPGYKLKHAYQQAYDELLVFAADLMKSAAGGEAQKRFRYWSLLALLRGVMSSPRAGARMLAARATRKAETSPEDAGELGSNPNFESTEAVDDELPLPLLEKAGWMGREETTFRSLATRIDALEGEEDAKVQACLRQVRLWQKHPDGAYSPVIFCRYIQTAHYVAETLEKALGQGSLVECVTSEDPDEVRRERVDAMEKSQADGRHRVLVATDCLSEGINLQNLFDAVLHYDLPWNPNRLEQREGRVDRFGQVRPRVQTCLLFGEDNPMDRVVLKVLYDKAQRIRSHIGVSIPFPEDSQAFMDAIFQAVLEDAEKKRRRQTQLELFGLEEVQRGDGAMDELLGERERKDKALRGIFAHHNVKAQDIEEDLRLTDEAVGRPEVVFRFFLNALKDLEGVGDVKKDVERLTLTIPQGSVPAWLGGLVPLRPKEACLRLGFRSPVAEGFRYLGRNHPAVETLCQRVLANSLDPDRQYPACARAAVVLSHAVSEPSVVLVLRARNVIEDQRLGTHLVAEEVLLHGWAGPDRRPLEAKAVAGLMEVPQPAGDPTQDFQAQELERVLREVEDLRPQLDTLAQNRAEELIRQHQRYHKALGQSLKSGTWRVVEPVIPLDVLGVYIFLPTHFT